MSAATLVLLVEPHDGECMQVHVARNPFVIGRLQECDLTLRDSRISRRHARIRQEVGGYLLEDLDSRHGLTVNGQRVRRTRLAAGDRIGFGIEDSFELTVGEAGSPQAPLLEKVSGLDAGRGRTGALGRLSAVLDVARTMEASDGVEDVFEAVVEAALTIARAERAFLLLRDESGRLGVKVARDASGEDRAPGDLKVPLSVIGEALDRRRELFSMAIGLEAGGLEASRMAVELDLRSALCVPILRMRIGQENETSVISAKRDTLGVLYMDTSDPDMRLAEGNQALLQALAIEISTVLENARLIEEERDKRRLEQELRMARGIQQALLPPALPTDGWLQAKGHCEPSAQLGGDYYDLMQVSPGKWAAIVADVSGKGVAASILASVLQGAFFLGSGPDVSLAGTLGRINRYLCERSVESRFVTVFGLLIAEDGSVRWSSAGHCPAILVRSSGETESLAPNSRPVGLFHDAEFAEDTCTLLPGDKLVIYSDGVSELRNAAGEAFGEGRLRAAAAAAAGLRATELCDALLERARDHAGSARRRDDLTLLVLGYEGLPAGFSPPGLDPRDPTH